MISFNYNEYSRPSIVRPLLYPVKFGLSKEVSCKTTLISSKFGLSKEVICNERWADMYGKCIRASYFWCITRGGLWWEGSLSGGTTVHRPSIVRPPLYPAKFGLSYGKCIRASYFWSITRGGLWWEGSLNGGTTVQ